MASASLKITLELTVDVTGRVTPADPSVGIMGNGVEDTEVVDLRADDAGDFPWYGDADAINAWVQAAVFAQCSDEIEESLLEG